MLPDGGGGSTDGGTLGSGSWSAPGFLTRRFKRSPPEFEKFDVTFSTSRDLIGDTLINKREGVYEFLYQIGSIGPDEAVTDVIRRMKIGSNKLNGQVVMECVSAEKAEQVHNGLYSQPALPRDGLKYGVTHCDANYMKDDKVPVFISWVRSTIDIKKYLIDGFLGDYGEVLSHRPLLDSKGVETFEHMFMMYQKDLQDNPPPNFFWLGRNKLKVRYKGQTQTCWICNDENHKAFECPRRRKRDPPLPCIVCNSSDHQVDKCTKYSQKDQPLLNQTFLPGADNNVSNNAQNDHPKSSTSDLPSGNPQSNSTVTLDSAPITTVSTQVSASLPSASIALASDPLAVSHIVTPPSSSPLNSSLSDEQQKMDSTTTRFKRGTNDDGPGLGKKKLKESNGKSSTRISTSENAVPTQDSSDIISRAWDKVAEMEMNENAAFGAPASGQPPIVYDSSTAG